MAIKFSQTDPKLRKRIRKEGLSKSRIREYDIVFTEIYDITGYKPSEIIDIAKKEQKPFNNNGFIEIMDIDDRTVTKIQDQYYDYLLDKQINGRPIMNGTIKNKLSVYRAFLNGEKIERPDAIKIKIKKGRLRDKDIPTWYDVNNAITLCKSPRDSAIIAFAVSTGLRISDIVSRKLKDLIDACEIYFEENEEKTLDNLLNKNPDNIVPCWELIAQKTEDDESPNLTVTFNTPEASRYIWFYLKDRFNRSKKKDENYVVDVNEPLFKSQRGGHLNVISVENHFRSLNARLGGEKDRNGIYIKFRLHNLRKLFKTTCRRNISSINVHSDKTFEGDVINLFAGHTSPNNPLGNVYEAVEDDSHDSHIRKVYQGLIPYLSIQPTDVKDVTTKQYKDLEKQNEVLQKKLDAKAVEMQRELDEQKEIYEQKISELEGVNSALASQVNGIQHQIDNIAHANDLTRIQDYISKHELVNEYNLSSIIIGYYKEDVKKEDFEGVTDDYIETLIYTAFNSVASLKTIEPRPEVYDDELWRRISSEIGYYEHRCSEGNGYQFSEPQKKKLALELNNYAITLWQEKRDVEKTKVEEIVNNIATRG